MWNGNGGQIATTPETSLSQTRDGINLFIYSHILRDDNIPQVFVLGEMRPLIDYCGSHILRIQIIRDAINFCFISPCGVKAKEQGKE